MNRRRVFLSILLAVFFLTSMQFLTAQGDSDESYYGRGGYGHMGGWGQPGYRNSDRGFGHMGGRGMMGGFYAPNYNENAERLSAHDVEDSLKEYVERFFGTDFFIEEIMEFEGNFYAQIGETGKDHLAVELLIDPYTGQIYPEFGPNMMWNQSYGHMRGRFWRNDDIRVSTDDAVKTAQKFLDYYDTGFDADDHVAVFDGYFTLHTLKDGEITGMLSVNSSTGDVWYHDWHGNYIGSEVSTHDEDDD